MRQYPKRCSVCGEYLEPVFAHGVGRYTVDTVKDQKTDVDPVNWKCVNENCRKVDEPVPVGGETE